MNATAAANRQLLLKLVVIACGMFGFGFALVPLYKTICDAVGLNSIIAADRVVNTQVDATRWVTIELDANTRALPWSFTPAEASVRAHPGELVHALYRVHNGSGRAIVGQAIPSYGPPLAAQYFKKLECFCFTQQALAPGETRELPVVFVIEPGLPGDVNTVTLSYTFFEVDAPAAKAGG